MTKNYEQAGNAVTVIAPSGGTTSGVGVLIGSLFGIAATTEEAGADVVLDTVGMFDHAKTSAQAWTVGALVYFDNTNKVMTTVSTSNKLVGVAVETAANPSDTGVVRLNGAFIA
ncbi:DUF2190 family protein [Jiella pelagia]|uniref:DUF2190 family protein n=1 Tax=Jiella pelagia TaxID=2986949 RepID=A0ABY7C112_9HYPH|nr:DUF2190 family protein [Jiella pelagia]WAP69045.1 DUF2190 family protein [Jiella pelagia]